MLVANRRLGEHTGLTYEDGKVGTCDYRAVIWAFDETLTPLLMDTGGRVDTNDRQVAHYSKKVEIPPLLAERNQYLLGSQGVCEAA
jgi:hypothetical protein